MKLKSYRVHEYRSVWDSGPVEVGEVTCLVGKNEAGKTSLLHALSRINPIEPDRATFDVHLDYPRREVGDYQHEVESGKRKPATVITATFALEDSEVQAVENVFGGGVLRSHDLTLSKGYANKRTYSLNLDETAARRHLIDGAELVEPLKAQLHAATNWAEFTSLLAAAEASSEVQRLRTLAEQIGANGPGSYAFNKIIDPLVPKFLYFDEYYQMTGHENIQALIARRDSNTLKPQDYPLLGLINLARIKLEDLTNTQRTVELVNKLQGASNHLSKQVLKYWSQNKHLQLKIDVREGKPQDPEHMRQGQNIWGRVHDQVHWADTELGSRSKGFIWFFSFLAWYEDVKREGENVILLLDEPGLSLHGRAQADLLRYIEIELKPHHQVIYTTHSPFMVDAANFDRVRIVQDAGIDSDAQLPLDEDGTKVLSNIFDGSDDSLFPLQGALGYDIHQSLFVAPNTLVVEGAADLLYLRAMSDALERAGREGLSAKWAITPVGGSGKVPTFVALLAPQRGMNVAVLMDFQQRDSESIEAIYKKKLLSKKNVLTYAAFTGGTESDVEDMFDRSFYVDLVNKEYGTALSSNLSVSELNGKVPRVLKAIEQHLSSHPMKNGSFGHYRPARYFTENLKELTDDISAETTDRFETLFKAVNKLLK